MSAHLRTLVLFCSLLSSPVLAQNPEEAIPLPVGGEDQRYFEAGRGYLYAIEAREGQRLEVAMWGDGSIQILYSVFERGLFGLDPVKAESTVPGIRWVAEADQTYFLRVQLNRSGPAELAVVDSSPRPRLTGVLAAFVATDALTTVDFGGNVALGIGYGSFDLVASIGHGLDGSRVAGILGPAYRFGPELFEVPYFRITAGLGYVYDYEFPARVNPVGIGARFDWLLSAEMVNALFDVDTNSREDRGPIALTLVAEAQAQMGDEFRRAMFGIGIGF